MAVNLSPIGGVAGQFFDNNGNPLSGGKIFTYAAGTTTPQTSYTSASGLTPHANPIILDAAGRVPGGEIWLTDGIQYKFLIKTSTDIQIGSYDNVIGINSNFVNYTNAQEIQTATAGQTVFTLATMQYQPGTNSLSVFVDGVNQYGPGSMYAYQETSSTVVTFTSGLHVGAQVKFTTSSINASSYGDAEQISYNPPFAGGVATNVEVKLAQYVSVKDFGATGAGYPTDDAAAIQAAFDASLNVYFPAGDYYIGSPVLPQNNSFIFGAGRSSHIIVKDGDTNGIDLTNKSGVTVRDLKLSCRGSIGTLGGLNGKGAIYLLNSTQCAIENNYIFNCYNVGIRLQDADNNTIRGNYFGDWYTTGTPNEDTGNIYAYGSCSYNLFEGNFCLGANAGVGIAVHEYYVLGKQPVGNIISNNRVDNKKAYGILVYTTGIGSPLGYDCRIVVSNNVVSNVYGDYITGASGAGIYLQGAGGALCTSNSVYNCCINTSNFGTLAMACITASITNEIQTAPIIVSSNQVHTLRGPGIWAASSREHGIHIQNNVVRTEDLTTAFNTGIRQTACSYSNVIGNTVYQRGSAAGIYVDCINVTTRGNNISNNHVQSTNAAGLGMYIARDTSGTNDDIVIQGNTINSVYDGMLVSYVNYASISDNKVYCGNNAFFFANSEYTNVSGNSFRSTAAAGYDVILAEGTGCVFDKLNVFTAQIQHTGLGVVEQYTYSGVPPIFGQYAVGDRVINRNAVVGQPKAWRCTVAGTPGTWTSEGNL